MTTPMRETILAAGALALVIVFARLAPADTTVPARANGEVLVRAAGGPSSLGAAPRDDDPDPGDDGGDGGDGGGGDDGSTED